MTMSAVYSVTTAPNPKPSCFTVPSENLDKVRFGLKVCEVLLSLVAFVLEEVVSSCIHCAALYFFEFISCTAFIFTLLLLILLATPLHKRLGISFWPTLDFLYTSIIALLFFMASIIFAVFNSNTTLERSAVVFGFLASVLFLFESVIFWKNRGFPWRKEVRAAADSSNGVPVSAPAETERLHAAE